MPHPYTGRHRAVPSTAPQPHPPRRARAVRAAVRPLSVSAVSLSLTLGLIHAATSLGETTRANALVPATMSSTSAPAESVVLPRAAGADGSSALPTPGSTPGSTPTPTAPSSTPAGVAPVADTMSLSGYRAANPRPAPTPPAPTIDPLKVWVVPVTGTSLTSTYGPRWGTMHRGIDLAGPVGLPLKALSSGVVTFAGQQSGYGNIVQIKYWDGTVSYYGHMNAIAVKVGDAVAPGQTVGQLGNSGESTGPHLHLEIHPGGGADVDPLPWIKAHGLAVS